MAIPWCTDQARTTSQPTSCFANSMAIVHEIHCVPGRLLAVRARPSVFHRAVQSRGRMGQYFGMKTQYIVFLSASMR